MTLDEAIKHCEEKAKELKADTEVYKRVKATPEHIAKCEECAREHEQLAEWLKELKKHRETMEMIKKRYILIEKGVRDNPDDLMIGRVIEEK